MIEQEAITILSVDDSPEMGRLLHRLFDQESDMKSLGSLLSADELVAEVQRLMPRVVLLDLGMPGRDPLDAVREISASCRATRIIVLSGHSDPAVAQSAMECGASAFMVKGCDVDAILHTVRKVAGSGCQPAALAS